MPEDSARKRWIDRCAAILGRPVTACSIGTMALLVPVLVLITGQPVEALAGLRSTTTSTGTPQAGASKATLPRRTAPVSASVSLDPRLTTTSTTSATGATATTSTPTNTTTRTPTSTTTTLPPATTTTTPATGVIGSRAGRLVLDGDPYTFTGVNAYEIATDWGVNQGCGSMLTDAQLDAFFAALPPNSLVRFWAFQGSMAVNIHTHQLDWTGLDRVFAAAAAHDQRLVVVLTGQGGGCDDGQWKQPNWYEGGFEQVDDPTGMTPLSYWDYVQAVVNRYKSSPAVGMWEPISEAEASTCSSQDEPGNCSGNQTCPDESVAAQALRHFFDTVGGEIHSLDPRHLVEDGLIGSGQCGTINTDFTYVSESPGIDVMSYHDYSDPDQALTGDRWNGLAVRLQDAAQIGKPIIGGEVGVMAGMSSACPTDAQRVPLMLNKIEGQMQAGSSGVLPWDFVPSLTLPCNWDIAPGDPLLAALATVPRQGPG